MLKNIIERIFPLSHVSPSNKLVNAYFYEQEKTPINLFVNEPFTSRAGLPLDWKIECDALSDADIETITAMIARRFLFRQAIGIPRGGLRLARALQMYRLPGHPILIIDDVFTTGKSMQAARKDLGNNTIGVVIFARGKCPDWITPIFQLTDGF